MRLLLLLLLSLSLSVLTAISPSTSFASEISTIRERIIDYQTAADADRNLSLVKKPITELKDQTAKLLPLIDGTGKFTDLTYQSSAVPNWGVNTHFVRIYTLAKAYKTTGSGYKGSSTVRTKIEKALEFGLKHYTPTRCTPSSLSGCGNWYPWEIGIPLSLNPTLLLLQGSINSSVFNRAENSIIKHISPKPRHTGQNLAWSAINHLYIALMNNDTIRMEQVKAAMVSLAKPSKEGIQVDWSFHQHGPQLMTGSYGAAFGGNLAEYVLWTNGTSYALPNDKRDFVASYIANGILWSIHGERFDISVLSRDITRPDHYARGGLKALLLMATIPSSSQSVIKSAAKKMLSTWKSQSFPLELVQQASIISKASGSAAFLSGNRVYHRSDFVIHRRSNYYASIKMFSTRTESGEIVNKENKKGSRASDGRLHLTLVGDEYHRSNRPPTLDWSRLPGITVERKPGIANSQFGFSTKAFVGGVTNGKNGVAAMDLAPIGSHLTAKKSWFFFDDSIVFLTNSIKSTSGHPIDTVINQWPLSSKTTPLYVNGSQVSSNTGYGATRTDAKWAYADRIGYQFFGSTPVYLKTEIQKGRWSDIGTAENSTEYSNPFLTLLHLHSANPASGTSAYAIVPGISGVSAMSSWVSKNYVKVLQNNSSGSAVQHTGIGMTGRVFWTAGKIASITSSAPCAIMTINTGDTLEVSYASPSQLTTAQVSSVTIRIDGTTFKTMTSASPGVKFLGHSGGKTVISFPPGGGTSLKAVLRK